LLSSSFDSGRGGAGSSETAEGGAELRDRKPRMEREQRAAPGDEERGEKC